MNDHPDSDDIQKAREEIKNSLEWESVHKPVCIDLDYVLTNELGQFGLYQIRTVILLLMATLFCATVQDYIFSAAATPHRCHIPECGEDGKLHVFDPEWIKNAIPETSSGLASCKRYAPLNFGSNGTLDYCPVTLFDQSKTIDCEGFVYARDNTLVYEFDLGCQEWMRALAGTLFNTGMLLALPITGYISDNFGRKIAVVFNVFNLGVFGLMRAFSVDYTMYLILQIVQSTLGTGIFSSVFIFATEVVGPKYRVVTGVSCSAAFAMGEVVLGGLTWLISPWRHVILVSIVPYFLFISYYWLISDSVRWHLSRKKYTEAKKILLRIAKVNKTHISEKSLEALVNSSQPSTSPNADNLGLIRTIIRSPVLRRRVCTTPFWWITTSFVYYGLSINSTGLSDTMHLNYILTAAVGIPGFYAAIFVLERLGRKPTVCYGYFISAACNIVFAFIPVELTILRLIVYLLGKFFISMVGTSLYLYTSELYPTEYRHTLLGFSSMIGRLGSIFAPLTPALMSYWPGIPSLLFGGMAVIAGLLALTQPETLGCKMPDTLAEAEAVGKPDS